MVWKVMQYLEVHDSFWENRKHYIVEYVAMHYICPELLCRADVAV
jgi:hypothetical protein